MKIEKKNIMIIDDEDIVRFFLSDMLQSIGYNTVDFAEPEKAIEYYRNNYEKVDLVFLDMTMPKLNGRETFFLLKQINRKIKSIVLSGFSINEDVDKILKEGCLLYIKKPVKINELEKIVCDILDDKQQERESKKYDLKNLNILDFNDSNIYEAVGNMGGNIPLYIKMLQRFQENYFDATETMRKMYKDERFEDLFVFSHSLKSVAASLGFSKIQNISEKIENVCNNNKYIEIPDFIDDLGKEISCVCEKIKNNLNNDFNEYREQMIIADVDRKTVVKYIDELMKFAKMNRPKPAWEIFSKNIKYVSTSFFGVENRDEIFRKLKKYDFETLVLYLQKIKTDISGGENEQRH